MPESLQDRIGASFFQISANSFFQTNSLGAEKTLWKSGSSLLELKGRETILDLYSGTGTIPIFLARSARRVIGMEIVESAVLDARRNCQANGIENCEFLWGYHGDLAISGLQPEVMIIDPPRAGMHGRFSPVFLKSEAERNRLSAITTTPGKGQD
ncbi:MAG: methyltransferase domain-containing protein [Desulfomicrobium escambiense]|nr:methyltransferase domain-containing protein [Desulfomicrobium escambiense]